MAGLNPVLAVGKSAMPKTIDEWAAENGYEKNQWGNYPNAVVGAYKDYTKNLKTGDLPKSPDAITNTVDKQAAEIRAKAEEEKKRKEEEYARLLEANKHNSYGTRMLEQEESKNKMREADSMLKDAGSDEAVKDLTEQKQEAFDEHTKPVYAGETDEVMNKVMAGEAPGKPGSLARAEAAKATEENNASTEGNGNAPNLEMPKQNFEATPINRYQPKSIMRAYYDGDFGEVGSDAAKGTRNYLLADAFGSFARNLGKSAGNVGAQYTGGSIDNSTDQSVWSKTQNKMADPEWRAQQEARERDNVTRTFNNNMLKMRGDMAGQMQKFINNAPNDTVRIAYMDIANKMLSGGSVNEKDLAVTGAGELINFLKGQVIQ